MVTTLLTRRLTAEERTAYHAAKKAQPEVFKSFRSMGAAESARLTLPEDVQRVAQATEFIAAGAFHPGL